MSLERFGNVEEELEISGFEESGHDGDELCGEFLIVVLFDIFLHESKKRPPDLKIKMSVLEGLQCSSRGKDSLTATEPSVSCLSMAS